MIVCLCRGVSEAALQHLIDAGATSLRQIGEACGAGTDCGACCPLVQELLACTHQAAR
jgi:bacterioferritin-associated ferredoxin